MNDGKIIIDKIIADADETVKKIMSEAKEKYDAVISEAQEKAAKEKAKNDKAVAEEKVKVAAKLISGAEMDAKKAVLAQKQTILEEVIKQAEDRLVGLSDNEYTSIIGKMLDNIGVENGTEVMVAAKDKDRLTSVIADKGLKLADKTADINGGFIVKSGDIEYNYSFDSIIAIEKEEIQQLAAKILFD
ncbi:V-type proton ATPase subunit E [Clostridiales bacterium]|nr:V-type proton ATPase subunit E [Clostridiales bacterium]